MSEHGTSTIDWIAYHERGLEAVERKAHEAQEEKVIAERFFVRAVNKLDHLEELRAHALRKLAESKSKAQAERDHGDSSA